VAVALSGLTPAAAGTQVTRAEYDACQTTDEATFARAINGILEQSMRTGLVGVDYRGLVADQWRRIGMDAILDKEVDVAVEAVRNETSLGNLVRSIANEEKAKELATAVAERVYRSDAVKSAIETLAAGVGGDVGRRIELASHDAAEPAMSCLKAFLGPRYGTTVAASVAGDVGAELGVGAQSGGAEVSPGAVLKQSGEGITGAAILVMRRQLANMATRIGQRIVGSILARLVSVVAGGIGLVLIAKDIWDLRKGVLPIIASEMKDKTTKDKVQEELAMSLEEQIGQHVGEISTKASERIVEVWRQFLSAHAKVLNLAERNEPFRTFLDSIKPDRLGRLDEVVALLLQSEGEPAVLKRLADGSLDEIVKSAPIDAIDIARETRNVDLALKWSSLAGDMLPAVVTHELHKRSHPDQFTKASLQRLLAIDDKLAVMRLGALPRDARDVLFERQPAELKELARAHGEAELTALAGYLTALPQGPRERVLKAVITDAGTLQVLSSDRVRNAILSSRDPSAAVDMMMRPAAATGYVEIVSDFQAAWDGRISPILLWERHTLAVLGLVAALIMLMLLARRIISPRRRETAAAN
jgi:nitrogen regulatory protein PII-like uncharacterized protein